MTTGRINQVSVLVASSIPPSGRGGGGVQKHEKRSFFFLGGYTKKKMFSSPRSIPSIVEDYDLAVLFTKSTKNTIQRTGLDAWVKGPPEATLKSERRRVLSTNLSLIDCQWGSA